jgi:pilus assembly protein CpaB
MKSRGLLGTMALVLAFVATMAVFLYLRGVKQTAKTGGDLVTVVVARQDLLAGTSLDGMSKSAFTTRSIPRDALVRGAVTSLDELRGKTVTAPILAGEQISSARLGGRLQGGALGIPKGYEAVTIPLDTSRVAGGAVVTGDHVAVFATFDTGGGGTDPTTAEFVPDAQVLKVVAPDTGSGGSLANTHTNAPTMVTLALLPTDVQKVVLAQEEGHVWLALLPPGQAGATLSPLKVSKAVGK